MSTRPNRVAKRVFFREKCSFVLCEMEGEVDCTHAAIKDRQFKGQLTHEMTVLIDEEENFLCLQELQRPLKRFAAYGAEKG